MVRVGEIMIKLNPTPNGWESHKLENEYIIAAFLRSKYPKPHVRTSQPRGSGNGGGAQENLALKASKVSSQEVCRIWGNRNSLLYSIRKFSHTLGSRGKADLGDRGRIANLLISEGLPFGGGRQEGQSHRQWHLW